MKSWAGWGFKHFPPSSIGLKQDPHTFLSCLAITPAAKTLTSLSGSACWTFEIALRTCSWSGRCEFSNDRWNRSGWLYDGLPWFTMVYLWSTMVHPGWPSSLPVASPALPARINHPVDRWLKTCAVLVGHDATAHEVALLRALVVVHHLEMQIIALLKLAHGTWWLMQ